MSKRFIFGSVLLIIVVIGLILFLWHKPPAEIKIAQEVSKNVPPTSSTQIIWNGQPLHDDTVVSGDICYGVRNNMKVTVSPCTAQDIDGRDIKQDVKFEWVGNSSQNVGWIFVYEGDLISGNVMADKNMTTQTLQTHQVNDWVTNYLVQDVQSYVDLGTPNSNCMIGNQNNTKMYSVTFSNGQTKIYCFSNISVVNSTAFRISGNYNKWENYYTSQEVTTQVDVTDRFTKIANPLNDAKSYYKVDEVLFNPQDVINTHWTFTPKDSAKIGKWHILGYDSDIGLVQSLAQNRYIYLDPWWDSNWQKRKTLNITGGQDILYNFTILVNVTYNSNFQADFDDVRFTSGACGSDTTELKYDLDYKVDSTYALVWVKIPTLNTGSANNICMYYGNPAATTGQDSKNAWDDNYKGVYHFSETSGNALNSKNGSINFTQVGTSPSTSAGFFGLARNVSGSSGFYFTVTDGSNYGGLSGITVEAFLVSLPNIHYTEIASKHGTNGVTNTCWTFEGKTYIDATTGAARITIDSNTVDANSKYWTFVWSGGAPIRFFNGTYSLASGNLASMADMSAVPTRLGYDDEGGRGNSTITEFRISNVQRASAWLNRTYNNLDNSYVTYGTEESSLSAPVITFINQSPADITSTNIVNSSVLINYTITHGNAIDSTQTNLFWLTNGSANTNFTWYVNGSIVNAGFTSISVIKSNLSSTWQFVLGDNIYPATYLLNLSSFENSLHSTFNLTTDNYAIKAIVLNMTNKTAYNLLEFMIENMTPTVPTLRTYYCNSTYSNGNFGTDSNCILIANIPANQSFNHIENQSRHWLASLPINTTTGTLNGIKITPTGYFIWRGRTEGWSSYYVSPIARTSATQTSTNTGVGWTDLAGTLDYHLHQFSDDTQFNYYVCANATSAGIYNCSAIRTDYINISLAPPSPPIVNLPANITYNVTIPINYSASTPAVGSGIVYYRIELYNSDDSFNRTITANNNLSLNYTWNQTDIVLGQFNIHVTAVDMNGFTAMGESALFSIYNPTNTTTSVSTSPVTPITYGTSSTFDCTNTGSLPTQMYINGINRTSEKGVSIVRGAGSYSINCSASTSADGAFLGSSQVSVYTVNQAAPTQAVALTPSSSVTYGTETTATGSSCPSELVCILTENNAVVSNPRVATLNAGTYQYNYTTPGNSNYSALSVNATLVVNKIDPSLSILISPSAIVTNGTITSTAGLGCPDSSCVLRRDGTVVPNPETTLFPIGTYVYNYTFLGSTNYNGASVLAMLSVNPVRFAGSNGTINFTSGNLSNVLSFQVPFQFVTEAYMNLSGNKKGVSNVQCYQETANVSTACGGLSTGGYTFGGIFSNWYQPEKIYDGNYSSDGYYQLALDANYLYINYTKPIDATSAIWQVKDLAGIANVSIPDTCWNNQTDKLLLRIYSSGILADEGIKWECQNSSGWGTIRYASTSNDIFEEGIYWNITDNYPTNVNVSQGSNQIFYYSGAFNQTNNRTNNFYNILNKYLSTCVYLGNYCIVPITFSSSTSGILNYSDVTFDNAGFIEVSQSFNSATRETSYETYYLNMSYDSSAYSMTATMIYDGVEYPTTTIGSGFNRLISSSLYVPSISGTGTKSFYWRVGLTNSSGTRYYNSTTSTQTVSELIFSICNSNYTLKVVNVTFKDESTASQINATIDSSSWNYASSIGGLSAQKTYTYLNTSHNYEYDFCIYPNDSSPIYANALLQTSKTDVGTYPSRKYTLTQAQFTNTSDTSLVIYLLNYNNGIASSYQVITSGNQVVPNAYVLIQKSVAGTVVKITDGYTDSSGIFTAFLNPNSQYQITVTKEGYESQTNSVYPSQSIYTITLGSGGTQFNYNASTEGLTYSMFPTSGGTLINGMYNFTFTVNSRKSNVYGCSFDIVYPNDTVIAHASGCSSVVPNTGGVISSMINMTKVISSGETRMYGLYYITLYNSTYAIERDANWRLYVSNSSNYYGGITQALNDSYNMPEWGDNPATRDYSRIVFIFLFAAIAFAILNFHTGYDTAYPGSFVYLFTILVVILSATGSSFFKGPGMFYLDGAVKLSPTFFGSNAATTVSQIFNNWILAAHFIMLSFIYFFTTNKRYQSG